MNTLYREKFLLDNWMWDKTDPPAIMMSDVLWFIYQEKKNTSWLSETEPRVSAEKLPESAFLKKEEKLMQIIASIYSINNHFFFYHFCLSIILLSGDYI